MSFESLRERVYTAVNDSARAFVKEEYVDMWLQEALVDVSSRLQLQSDSQTGTTTTEFISLPANFVSLIWLKLGDDFVAPVPDAVFNSFTDAEETPDVPLIRYFQGQFEVYPEPTVGTAYELRYWNSSADDLTAIREDIQNRLVNYGRAMACYNEKQVAMGDRYMAMYESGLPAASHSGARVPGPIQIGVAPGYFDSSGYLT